VTNTRSRLLVSILVSFFCGTAFAQQRDSGRAATVNGESISMKEVEDAAAEDLESLEFRRTQFEQQLKRDRQSAIEDTLDKMIRDRLLSAEAKKRNISADELIAIQVDGTVAAPTDEAVVQFYNSNKSQMRGSLGENAANIREYLRSLSRQTTFDNFIARLYRDYEVKSFIEPERTLVATEGQPSKGPAGAPVTLVEFADFECPYCGSLFPTLQKIEADYKDKLRVVYVQFPLVSIHSHAEKAAEASLCANEQGKFWQMHDAMFSDQANLTVDDLKQKAAHLDLNGEKFNACLDGGKSLAEIRSDLTEGVQAGVSGTPAMFINGRFLQGSVPYGEIQKLIEDELRRVTSN
jgi:predicted DsbA family dithiol-disulfide isomerase